MVKPRLAEQRKWRESKPDASQVRQRWLQFYLYQCYGQKDQKSWTPESQSSQKKTRAMVAQSNEDGEEAKGGENQIQRKFEEEWYREIDQQWQCCLPCLELRWSDLQFFDCRFTADGGPYLDRCAIGLCLPGLPVLQRALQGDVCYW